MKTVSTHIQDEILIWEDVVGNKKYGRYSSELEKRVIVKALSLATKPTKALDIGCEGGQYSKLLSDHGWELTCTEIDQRSLNVCQKRIPTAKCILVTPNDSTFPGDTESMGMVLCMQVPAVIHADWFFDEAFRVMEKGGLMVGVMWNRSSWRGLMYHSIPALRRRGSGQWYWYPQSYPLWRERFCKRGFTMLYEEGYAWPPFRRTSDSLLVPVATQIEGYLGLRKLVGISPMIRFIAQKN